MTRITIDLKEQEIKALLALATREFRDPRGQAALIIRRELERLGFLAKEIQANAVNGDELPAPTIKQEGSNVSE